MKVDTSNLPDVVTWFSLVAGGLCVLVGLWVAFDEAGRRKEVANEVKDAVKKAVAEVKKDQKTEEDLTAQGAIGDTLESLAKLATALKDLDIGTRILFVGLALFAIAGIAAGVDSVATAVA